MSSLRLPGKFTANLRGLWRKSNKRNHYTQAGSHWVAFKALLPIFCLHYSQFFVCLPNFVVPRKFCCKHIMKQKSWSLKMCFFSKTLKPGYRPENTLLSNTEWSGGAHFHLPYNGVHAASIAMHATSLHSLEGMLRLKISPCTQTLPRRSLDKSDVPNFKSSVWPGV